MNQATTDYIRQHADADVGQLALRSAPPEVDVRVALQQIEGRQLAARKMPTLAAIDGILYPPRLSLEQCSSEQTAMYKKRVIHQLYDLYRQSHEDSEDLRALFCDLTGGLGIDFGNIAPLFLTPTLEQRAIYVERNAELCNLARHNFPLMGLPRAEVVCATAEEVLQNDSFWTPSQFVCILIDPARRDSAGHKVALIEDCTPDVCALQELLRARAHYTLIKLSPMLDIAAATRALRNIEAVHVVSVAGECKELLLVMGREERPSEEIPIHCVDWDATLTFTRQEEAAAPAVYYPPAIPPAGCYLYEPNASILKAGAFKSICQRFPVQKLAQNTHLYVADALLSDFPGRTWRVVDTATFNKKELRRLLCGVEAAELTVRGFPLSVASLRKQFHLREGGTAHFIATTIGKQKMLLRVERL